METQPQPLIEMEHISKIFHTPAGDFPALKNVSVNFRQGEFVGILGKSGSGKSTLINMITGIDHPTQGRVRVSGIDIHQLKESRMAVWRGKNLGVVFQFFQLLPMISVIDNLLLPMDLAGMYTPDERVDKAFDLLRLVGMEAYADKMPNQLAGGQQQSVAVARALANDPPIIAADEPTGNLDSGTADAVFGIFEELVKRGKTIIMVTHDPMLAKRTSRTVLLCDGEVVHPLIAEALPTLAHRQMLEITQTLQAKTCQPGEWVVRAGEQPGFYLVQSGRLELVVHTTGGVERIIRRVGQGQFISKLDFQAAGGAPGGDLSLRSAGGEAAEILAAGASDLERWLAGFSALRQQLQPAGEAAVLQGAAL